MSRLRVPSDTLRKHDRNGGMRRRMQKTADRFDVDMEELRDCWNGVPDDYGYTDGYDPSPWDEAPYSAGEDE